MSTTQTLKSESTKLRVFCIRVTFLSVFAEDEHRQKGAAALLHSVVMRLGALLVLMLAMGDWSDVLHVLIAFLGEAVCLLPSRDLLQAVLKVWSLPGFVLGAFFLPTFASNVESGENDSENVSFSRGRRKQVEHRRRELRWQKKHN